MADLSVNLRGIRLKNPVMPAAGPQVRNAECMMECVRQGVGALVTKTISQEPAEIPRPCMQQTKSGLFLNSELWSEISAEQWVKEEYEKCKYSGVPFIVSLGYTAEEIERLIPIVSPYADVIEISTHYMEKDIEPVIKSLKIAKLTDKPVYIKISPGITKIGWYVKRLVEEGADGFVAINSLGPCLNIDIETGLPYLGSEKGYGWLSGKSLNPIALRYVYSIANSVKVPVIGAGGISSGEDVIAMVMAGASAVQICTAAILEGPTVYSRIIGEMDSWLNNHGYNTIEEIRGLTARKIAERKVITSPVFPNIDRGRCISCGKCARGCTYNAIEIKDTAVINKTKCFGCGLCITRCPELAIKI
ncbi:4Fe-4S binding protein [Clostridium sp. CX1]|uniref:Dihydroorotate dehydrogenase B (NAD(+)), catalytic subunit n=1 Tax=Clostridium tanneri TaxID=3037988 RepID=A0ABU4JXU0_9CLOT|nr:MULTISPECIES: 4Fe-4S dicluster-binding protein [unclassified Clostridium]MCT8977327.1 4Fe-4S binding protein [Clostridium sp. CX1]MDW8802932.1 4Fe-4S binding protein [Clostridium sp. A1-XYC3]